MKHFGRTNKPVCHSNIKAKQSHSIRAVVSVLSLACVSMLTGCPFEFNKSDTQTDANNNNSSNFTNHDNNTQNNWNQTTQSAQNIPKDVDLSEIDLLIPETKQNNQNNAADHQQSDTSDTANLVTNPDDLQPNTENNRASNAKNRASHSINNSTNNNTINNEWLVAHNQLRTLHQVSNLMWSDALAKQAQQYADSCPAGHSKQGKVKYGENLAFSTAPVMSYTDVVKAWYDEINLYDFNHPKFSLKVGHFTQVVWKTTTQVGCGYKSGCETGDWSDIWVCQYQAPGNILGQFAQNVLPATKARDKSNDNSIKFDNELQITESNTNQTNTNHANTNQTNTQPAQLNKPLDKKYAQIQIEVKEGKKVLQGEGITITQGSNK